MILVIKLVKISDIVRISKYRNIFAKGCTPNSLEEASMIKKFKNNVPWTYVINDFNREEILRTFYKEELQKTNQQEFKIKKLIKKKVEKLHFKWKECNNSFNSWIYKQYII